MLVEMVNLVKFWLDLKYLVFWIFLIKKGGNKIDVNILKVKSVI